MSNVLDDLLVVVGRPGLEAGVRPQAMAPAVTSYSLPKSQTPTFLPAKSAGSVMFAVLPRHRQGARALEDLGDVDEVGAGLARPRAPSAPSEIVNSGPSGAEPTVLRARSSGRRRRIVTSRPSAS